MMKTEYVYRTNVSALKNWLDQFEGDAEVFIGGTQDAGYVVVGKDDAQRVFSLFDDAQEEN
jgi:hypothetical protein